MQVSGVLSAASRRAMVVVGLAAVLGTTTAVEAREAALRQDPAPQQAQQQEPPDQLKFSSEATLVFMTVSAEGRADFESVMAKVKEVLAKSDKPERRAQAAGWQVFRADAEQGGMIIYALALNPVVKDVTYDPIKILTEGGVPPEELTALYTKLSTVLKGINVIGLTKVMQMGGGH